MKRQTRHQKRAAGNTQTSISLRADLLARARAEAQAQGRTLSNWVEQMLRDKFPEVEANKGEGGEGKG